MLPSPALGGRALALALASIVLTALLPAVALGEDEGWHVLVGPGQGLDAWRPPTGDWYVAGDAHVDPDNPKRLVGEPGDGVIINGKTGRTTNLTSRETFGPVEAHVEFMIPKGSNAGVKFVAVYEVQIFDSWGVERPKASDCGGIYPRAELLPRYHYLDEGFPPRVNACKPPGEWQALDVIFQPARFDDEGKKVANARFVKVVLNGQVVHDDQEVPTPTGHNWSRKEEPSGPILLQADHGPVAFRDVRVRPWSPEPSGR